MAKSVTAEMQLVRNDSPASTSRGLLYKLRQPLVGLRHRPASIIGLLGAFACFLVPLVAWTGPVGARMQLGGDASLLFFEYPWMWLLHGAVNPFTNNLGGYDPQTAYAPFLAVLSLLKLTDLNVQGITLGLVLAFSFTGTRRLTLTLLNSESSGNQCAAFLAGTIVTCAPLLAATQWTALLPRVLWLGLTPWLIVMCIRHQRVGGFGWPLFAGLLVAFTAPAALDAPGTVPAVVTFVLILVIAAVGGSYTLRPKRLLGFGTAILLLNVFWLGPFLAVFPFRLGAVALAAAKSTQRASSSVVQVLAKETSLSDALGLRVSRSMAISNGWVGLSTLQWSSALWWIGTIPSALIVASAARLGFGGKRITRKRLALLAGILLLAFVMLFLLTAKPIPHGGSIMAILVGHIPGWTVERNFWSTWAPAFTLALALAVGLWASLIFEALPIRPGVILVAIICAALVLYDLPFFAGTYFRLPYSPNYPNTRVVDGLSPTYLRVVHRLQRLPPGSVLSVPLNSPTWTRVPSSQRNPESGAYIGISPIFYLTGRPDYNGLSSFNSAEDPGLSDALLAAMQSGRLQTIADLAANVGARYVVSNDAALTDLSELSLAPLPSAEEAMQTQLFLRHYANRVLFRSGAYSIRALSTAANAPRVELVTRGSPNVRPRYLSKLAYGAPIRRDVNCAAGSAKIVSWRVSHIVVTVSDALIGCELRVLVPDSGGWTARVVSSPNRVVNESPAGGNSVSMAFKISKGSSKIDLSYRPVELLSAAGALSVVSLFVMTICALVSRRKSRSALSSMNRT